MSVISFNRTVIYVVHYNINLHLNYYVLNNSELYVTLIKQSLLI
jgi:hypothetical protein